MASVPTYSQAPAQAPATLPAFEVATIRPSSPEARNSHLDSRSDRVSVGNLTLDQLIKFAYHLNDGSDDQIIGGPKWLHTAHFDIDAKEDEATAAAVSKMNSDDRLQALELMLQTLLADRFLLKIHHETRSLSVLALTIAPGGPKLRPPTGKGNSLQSNDNGSLEAHNAPLTDLVNELGYLPEISGRMVVDQTGLTGHYDFKLTWTPQQLADNNPTTQSSSAPGLFAALPEQLGLKLKSTKAPVDVIVIDHVDPPTPN
ncbi:MAG: TIGR03435 family protein [Acidobacteriaceae bacterium]